jgi:hypothetical protein
MAFFRNFGVNRRNRLCGVHEYASAQFLDFLELAENCSFLDRKLTSAPNETVDGHNLTNPIDEFKENRYLRVQAWFTLPRAGTSSCERLTGVAFRDMLCSLFFEIEPCLEMDYVRDPLQRHKLSCHF